MPHSAARLAALAGALLLGAGAFAAVRALGARRAERERLARGETKLEVLNRSGSEVRLFRAGAALDEAAPVPLEPGGTWLAEGNYFLEARASGQSWLYSVSLAAARIAGGGSYAVTVRTPGRATPPLPPGGTTGFAYVPAGPFLLGERRNPREPHYAWTTSFYLGVFEVTNGEFRRFLSAPDGWADRRSWTAAGWAARPARTASTAGLVPGEPDYGRFGEDDLPVVLVSWFEANAYARWLTRAAGGGRWLFRLPTEAEWEKAARGPDGFDFGLGAELSEPQMGLYNWKKNPGAETTLVGVAATPRYYRPNRYGIWHASGNAAEWTQSVSRPYNREAPWRDDERNADESPGLRSTRGGSWYSATTSRLSLAYREEFQPELTSNDLGFRIAAFPLP
jgi:formylglycine-generating enzyme required for sulfatase activity